MFTPNSKSFLDHVMDAEVQNFKTNYVSTHTSYTEDDPFVDANVLYKIPINKSSMKSLTEDTRYPVTEGASFSDYKPLMDNTTDQILNIAAKASFTECLSIIADYRAKTGLSFYGALLRDTTDKNIIINPFHILAALAVMNDDTYLKESRFNIIIFFYKDRAAMDDTYSTYMSDLPKVNSNIDSLLQSFVNKVTTTTKVDSVTATGSASTFKVSYRNSKAPDEHPEYEHYIVAHQIMTQGIICPYYGSSLIQINGQSKGAHLSPFRSCNISPDGPTASTTTRLSYESVCTGSLNNTTLHGLRSLTHSNLSSPYDQNNILDGALAYADTMINKCFQLYIKANLLPDNSSLIVEPAITKPGNSARNALPLQDKLKSLLVGDIISFRTRDGDTYKEYTVGTLNLVEESFRLSTAEKYTFDFITELTIH